jgi:hypothetical protein
LDEESAHGFPHAARAFALLLRLSARLPCLTRAKVAPLAHRARAYLRKVAGDRVAVISQTRAFARSTRAI